MDCVAVSKDIDGVSRGWMYLGAMVRMGNITYIDERMPHVVSEVICVKCCKRWISVRPQETLLKHIECPNCGAGAIIETGQEIKEGDTNV